MQHIKVHTPVFLSLMLMAHGLTAGPTRLVGEAQLLKGQQTGRGFITHAIKSAPGGAILSVSVIQDRTNSKVSLLLADDGTAYSPAGNTHVLTDGVSNSKGYETRFQFFLDYRALGVSGGKKRVVIAQFPSGHRWGGTDRGGAFTLPSIGELVSEQKPIRFGEGVPVSSLDVAIPISAELAEGFKSTHGGLKVTGQIRSRVEAEGKYQLSENDFLRVRPMLFSLVGNPALSKDVLGSDWTIQVETRYMLTDRRGKLLYDDLGFPIPDPMVDTYYDNRHHDAAKNDVAIRYRWTEANQTGSWNFKPGAGRVTPEGIVYRVEYAVDTTDDRPESIAPFASSSHGLNPFQLLRALGRDPGSFFYPSVRIRDTRYKFILTHRTGIAIEVSLDRVMARRLQVQSRRAAIFYQLEMDIEHVATQGTVQKGAALAGGERSALIHSPKDISPMSPTLETGQETFSLATEVILKLRDHLLGASWAPGAQKYAYAAALLGMVRTPSESVKLATCGESLETAR